MSRDRRIKWPALVGAVAALALAAVVFMAVSGSGAAPDQPVPVVWDRESCAHCRMAVGEPRFAAQLVATDGTVANFDDVGCLLRYLDERHPQVHRLWFHHPSEDRWLSPDQVGFQPGATTPMGWGLVAAERRADLLDLPAARAYVASRDGGMPGAMR